MSLLLVDIGNSRVKWARAEPGLLGEQHAAEYAGWAAADWRAALFDGAPVQRTFVASVAGGTGLAALDAAARAATGRGVERVTTQRTAAGLVNGYADPGLLGVDRWLAVIGGYHHVGGACVVADIGTAATVDVVAADGRHCGGYIVPGPQLMGAALFGGTSDLAAFTTSSPAGGAASFADNTRDAIQRGCRLALGAWLDRCLLDAAALLGGTPRLLLTGGARREVMPFLAARGEEIPDLVLRGLLEVASRVPD